MSSFKSKKSYRSVLFYVNPTIVRDRVDYYRGAIENKLIPIAKAIAENNFNIQFTMNESDAEWMRNEHPEFSVTEIKFDYLFSKLNRIDGIEQELYSNPDSETSIAFANLLKDANIEEPDLIIAWETPTAFWKDIYPNAKIIDLMPGFLSRLPFPELFTIDTSGLFKSSLSYNSNSNMLGENPHPEAIKLIEEIRSDILPSIKNINPFPRSMLDPTGEYEKILLLPLQVSQHYAFKADSIHEGQLSLLIDTLSKIPSNIGVVVTQYKSKSAEDVVLDDIQLSLFKKKWNNLIYLKEFELLDHSSQYLLASVDGVVSFSSSIAIQSILWQKPYISIGDSHLSPYANYNSIEEWVTHDCPLTISTQHDIHLANMLSFNHVLRDQLIKPQFIGQWIQNILQPASKALSVFDIEPDYRNIFLGKKNLNRAIEICTKNLGHLPNAQLEIEFNKLLLKKRPKLISFDIFDTLIDRKVEQPIHVFRLIQEQVKKITDGIIFDFVSIRVQAERSLRQHLLDSGSELQEISLDQIYDSIALDFGLEKDIVEEIKKLEIEEELRQLDVRLIGRRLFDLAVGSGCRVILISDMYLPEKVIQDILIKCGYTKDIPLYLSSSLGVRKHEGDLFDLVKVKENILPNKWLHIGDNPHGDIEIPKEKGIETFHIPSAFKNTIANIKYEKALRQSRANRTIAESAIYGLTQRRFFDNPYSNLSDETHFGGNATLLGYSGIGPVFFGFLSWLMNDAKQKGIDNVVFLSRDGYPLWKMAEKLYSTDAGWPKITYAYASRRALRIANLYTNADILALVNSSASQMSLYDFFERKFGIDLFELNCTDVNTLENLQPESIISASEKSKIAKVSLKLSKHILEHAQKQRAMLADYYQSIGITQSQNCAVVDIGYSGSLQASISRITEAKNLSGYYYITFDTALQWREYTGSIMGYAGDFVNPKHCQDIICKHGFLFETLFCSSEDSFDGFARDQEGNAVPIFNKIQGDEPRRKLIEKVHAGAILLAQDLDKYFNHALSDLQMHSSSASFLLKDLILSPSGVDAELFENCLFDDSFAGSKSRCIVPSRNAIIKNPKAIDQAVWTQGAKAFSSSLLNEKNKDKKKKSSKSSFLIKAEAKLINAFVKNKNKRKKYNGNRKAFFRDSNNYFVQAYYNYIVR